MISYQAPLERTGGGHAVSREPRKQCRWAKSHGGDGFLLCGHNSGHEGFHHDVYEVLRSDFDAERDEWSATLWLPSFMWEAYTAQMRKKVALWRQGKIRDPFVAGGVFYGCLGCGRGHKYNPLHNKLK